MGQTTIKIKCTDQRLRLVDAPMVASGGFNEVAILFDFCPLWGGFTKVATFYVKKEETYYAEVDENNTCIIPHEVLENPGHLYFGVLGVDANGVTRTSEVIKYKIVQGATSEDHKPSDPTPDIYEQILAKLSEKGFTVDADLSTTSANPVQNRLVTLALEALKTETNQSIAAHTENKNNPHGVTIQQIGAAPSGYGLGHAKRITAAELDTTTAPGFYDIAETMTINNITANYWYLFVYGMDVGSTHCTQMLRAVNSERCLIERNLKTRNWDAWKCAYPPMVVGVEYCTTEMWKGKVVYKKLLDFATLPNTATKTVHLNVVPTEIKEIKPQIVFHEEGTSTFCQETAPSAEFVNSVRFLATISTTGGSVLCHTNRDMTNYAAKVVVKYTKD